MILKHITGYTTLPMIKGHQMHLGNCKANGHEDRFVHQNRRVLRFTNSFSLNKKGLSFDVSKVKHFDPQQQDI